MRNPVKTAKRQLLRVGSCALSALMVLGSIPAAAIGDGVTATYDEAYYAMTDYYGNLTDGSVVKSYRTNGIATLTDYGDYDEIINLTDGTVPARNGGMTTFRLDEKALPGTFYFEGKTTKPFQQLPWTISMSYTLNGVPTKAEDLAGQAGVVEIRLDIVPNGRASEYARNNYTLEAMAIFNQDDILSLEAPGAQVQLIGNLRAVLFLGLPGEECHYTIRVGSEDFAFGGMTFLMVPATLSQLEEIAKLSERKDDLEDNYNKLSGSIDSLLDAMTAMTGSLNASANGLEQLNKARGIFSDGKGVIYSGTDALREDLSNLADVLGPVEGQIEALSKTITDSKSTLRSMTNTVSDLKDDLKDVESALRDLEDGTGDVRKVFSALGSLRESLKKLQKALGGTVKDTTDKIGESIGKNQNIGSVTVAQVKEAHSAYVADRQTYFAIILKKQGSTDAAGTAKNAAAKVQQSGSVAALETELAFYKGKLEAAKSSLETAQGALQKLKEAGVEDDDSRVITLNENIKKLEAGIKKLEAGIEQLEGVIALEEAYQAKESMSFQTFCEKVLGQSAATAKQMNDLWLVYASGKVEGGDTPDQGGTLSGELLHNDPEDSPEKDTSGGDSAPSGDHSDGSSEKTPDGSGSESTDAGSGTGDQVSSGAQNPPDSSNTDENGSENTGSGENNGENNGGGSQKDPTDAPNPPDPENPGTETEPDAPLPPSESVGGAVVDLISGGLDSAMAEIAKLQKSLAGVMNRLKDPTSQVISDLSALCGRIENLSSLLNSAEDLSAAIRHSSADLRDILDDVEDLQDILDDYEPVLQDTLKTVSSLSASAIKTIRDTQGLISDTEALMKSTGATLDDGTKQTLEGLAAVLRSTAKTMGTAGQIKDAKSSICDIIEDTWDEYTGDVNNLLLMDATAEAVSLTDSRNPSPESIQILIRTQEITMPDEDETEAEAAAEVQTTFWGRVAQMFKDFWAAITGLFGGKD
jgi:ABC-type transporter Mla subunit MlaD